MMRPRLHAGGIGRVSALLIVADGTAAMDAEDFLVVVTVAAIGGTIAALLGGRGVLVPAVVIELLLGVLIGPQVLGLDTSEFLAFFSDLGLGMLFFFAGYELDLRRIAGTPLRLAAR